MALVKKDYGLIYNDDGSLCTTIRDDDIPFQGVNSWAVEEATTNLFDSFSVGGGSNVQNPADDPTGKFSSVIRINPKSVPTYYGKDITTVVDSPYSGQVWCYVSNDFDGTGSVGLYCEHGLNNLKAYYNKSKKGTWQLLKKENILATSTSGRLLLYVLSSFTTGFVLFARQQVEQKPFASSFVDGSRPNGNLRIPVDLANMGNFVLSFWVKMNPYYLENTQKYFRIGDFKNQSNWNFDITIRCYPPDLPYINIRKREEGIITQTSSYSKENLAIDWAMITLLYDDGLIKLFYDGQKVIEQTFIIPNMYGNNELLVGHPTGKFWSGESGGLGIVSNIFVGKYKKPDGTVIWTDDYIREVYEAKIPFSEQNKLSIY